MTGLADLDLDGHSDLVFERDDGVYMAPGDGAGFFGGPVRFHPKPDNDDERNLARYAFADANGDGHADLILMPGSRYIGNEQSIGARVLIYQATTAGPVLIESFASGVISNGDYFQSPGVACADTNGDGRTEIAVTDYGLLYTGGSVGNAAQIGTKATLLESSQPNLYRGAARYPSQGFLTRTLPVSIDDATVFMDLNGDNAPDVVSIWATDELTVLINDGEGRFLDHSTILPHDLDNLIDDVRGLALADVSRLQVVAIGDEGAITLEFDSSIGPAGRFRSLTQTVPLPLARAVVCLDADYDGDMDAIVSLRGTIDQDTGAVVDGGLRSLAAAKNGTLSAPTVIAEGFQADRLVTGEFNGDGIPDIACTEYGATDDVCQCVVGVTLRLYLGDGLGGFTDSGISIPLSDRPWNFKAADMTGDGIDDVIALTLDPGRLSVISLAHDPPRILKTERPELVDADFGVGDVDCDADLDIVLARSRTRPNGDDELYLDDRYEILTNNGAGALATTDFVEGAPFLGEPFIIDIDQDGDVDLLSTAYFSADLLVTANLARNSCDGDVNADGFIDFTDLAALLDAWGADAPGCAAADFDDDGAVSFSDLNELLERWASPCD